MQGRNTGLDPPQESTVLPFCQPEGIAKVVVDAKAASGKSMIIFIVEDGKVKSDRPLTP